MPYLAPRRDFSKLVPTFASEPAEFCFTTILGEIDVSGGN